MRKRKKNKINISIPILLFRFISILVIFICLYRLYDWYLENKENTTIINNIRSQISFPDKTTELMDFSKIITKNSDTVAWIKIKNTKIDFPIVKTDNNDYYINHNFNKEPNSAGWIFADYRNKLDNTDKNIIIYGHNRRDGSMFSTLNNVLKKDWYTNESNHIVKLYTPSETLEYKIFSIYKIYKSDFKNTVNFETDEEFDEYIKLCKEKSIYNFNLDVTSSDNILTVYTCANNNRYRIIVHAKQIKN